MPYLSIVAYLKAFEKEEVELAILRSLLIGGLLDEAHELLLAHIL